MIVPRLAADEVAGELHEDVAEVRRATSPLRAMTSFTGTNVVGVVGRVGGRPQLLHRRDVQRGGRSSS